MRKIIVCVIIIALSASLFTFPVYSATYSIPSISSTICTRCDTPMSFVREEGECFQKQVLGTDCPNHQNDSSASSTYHYHTICNYYSVYICDNCGIFGRMYTRRSTTCQIGGNTWPWIYR